MVNRVFLLCLDGAALIAALWLGPALIHLLNPAALPAGMPTLMSLVLPNPVLPSGVALVVVWFGSLHATSAYDPDRMTSSPRMLNAAIKAGVASELGIPGF